MPDSSLIKKLVVWIFVAISLGIPAGIAIYNSGERNISYIAAMAIALVVAVAIADPKRFSSLNGASRNYRDDSPYERRPGFMDMLDNQENNSSKTKTDNEKS